MSWRWASNTTARVRYAVVIRIKTSVASHSSSDTVYFCQSLTHPASNLCSLWTTQTTQRHLYVKLGFWLLQTTHNALHSTSHQTNECSATRLLSNIDITRQIPLKTTEIFINADRTTVSTKKQSQIILSIIFMWDWWNVIKFGELTPESTQETTAVASSSKPV